MYSAACRALIALRIDDPIEASQVHGCGGILGLLLAALFDRDHGAFYGKGGRQFGVQVAGIVAICAWSGCISCVYFYLLFRRGTFRVPRLYEIVGLDYIEHGGPVATTSK